jgi:hypothetical protein
LLVVGKRPDAQETKERLAKCFADAGLMPELMQGFLVWALAMLWCCIQISKLELQLHIFFEDGPQGAPCIAVSTFQDLIDRCIERVVFHNNNNGNLPPRFPFERLPARRSERNAAPGAANYSTCANHAQPPYGQFTIRRILKSAEIDRQESRRDARPTYRNVCQLPDGNQNTGVGIICLNANNKLRLANTAIARAEKAKGWNWYHE